MDALELASNLAVFFRCDVGELRQGGREFMHVVNNERRSILFADGPPAPAVMASFESQHAADLFVCERQRSDNSRARLHRKSAAAPVFWQSNKLSADRSKEA